MHICMKQIFFLSTRFQQYFPQFLSGVLRKVEFLSPVQLILAFGYLVIGFLMYGLQNVGKSLSCDHPATASMSQESIESKKDVSQWGWKYSKILYLKNSNFTRLFHIVCINK